MLSSCELGKVRSVALRFAVASVASAMLTCPAMGTTYTPAQLRAAYGVDGNYFHGTPADGTGQTIAIIDWFDDPYILTSTAAFNTRYGLPQFNVPGGPTLTVVNQTGGSTLPSTKTASLETALDVQWAHAIAPMANILLVEPNAATFGDTNIGVNYAKSAPGVSVISMSYGANDFNGEAIYENTFTQAAGHAGVTFVASTGDKSAPQYPAVSQHVVALGGTYLQLDANNQRTSESVWFNNANSATGAGVSQYMPEPAFQLGVQQTGHRSVPDLSMVADPNSGVYVVYGPSNQVFTNVGGTSLSAPMFAGVMALANQGRALNGLPAWNSDDLLAALYSLASSPDYNTYFYDVTAGSSNGYSAGPGWDIVSGLGAPNVAPLIQYLAGYQSIPEPAAMGFAVPAFALLLRRKRA